MYSKLKFESGVHRVQRVPATESSGRVHTSTATVAVMPEVDDVDVQIDPKASGTRPSQLMPVLVLAYGCILVHFQHSWWCEVNN